MKRTLLILILCLFASGTSLKAQTVLPASNMQQCDFNGNGVETFDLSSKIPELLNGADAATHTVSFYTTLAAANTGINAITNLNYTSSGFQTIYGRVTNTVNSTFVLYSFQLIVNQTSNGFAALTFCNATQPAVYDLNQATLQFNIAPNTNSQVTYYLTFNDAISHTNPFPSPFYTAVVNPGISTVYANYINTMGCQSVGTINLHTNTCATACPTPTNLTVTNITDTSFVLNWSNQGISVTNSLISVVPQGSPASNANAIALSGNLPYMITGWSPNECYTVYVKNVCSPNISSDWSLPYNICMPDCSNSGDCSQALVLNAFVDSNANGVKDAGEVNFPYGTFTYEVNNSGTILNGYNNNGSFYLFDSNPTNSYDLSFAINSNVASYYACSTTYSSITLPTGSGTNNYYFPVTITNPHVDASVSMYANGQPRPGFVYNNTLIYKNNGTLPIANGTVSFTKDANVTITNISQAGTIPTTDGFSYDFTNLAPFETRYIYVTLLVPTIPTVQLGNLLTNSATVTIANDVNLTNNAASITQTVVGSYDPNDKMEAHGKYIVFEDFTADDYLTYTIRFENTGTANAEFIRIEDALNSQLDENSFELISASHEVNVRRNATALTFHFYNINLPPSSINIDGGHGYVQFKIKPKSGYALGDIIPNTASIFFDYNPPIVTNTFETEFVQALKTSTFTQDSVVIYPNPASNLVQVALNSSVDNISKVTLVNILGKTILEQQHINSNQTTINTSSLAKGMYLIKVTSETNDSVVKKLIIH